MCLFDRKRFRFTFKRIPVYKIVRYDGIDCKQNKIFTTPYQHIIVKNQMSGFDSFISTIKKFIKYLYTDYKHLDYYKSFLFKLKTIFCGSKVPTHSIYAFGEGFIHAFKDKTTAQDMIFYSLYKFDKLVIEGYIPAFTRYQIGDNDICARRMIFPNI